MKKVITIFIVLQIFCASVYAIDNNPIRKAARGIVNVVLAFVEVPRQIIQVTEDEGEVAGLSWGVAKGFSYVLGRVGVGVYEIATFLIPPYRPILKPEFIFPEEED